MQQLKWLNTQGKNFAKKNGKEKTQICGKREKKCPNRKRQFLKAPKKTPQKNAKKKRLPDYHCHTSTSIEANFINFFRNTVDFDQMYTFTHVTIDK